VAGQHEVKRARREKVEDVREVTQQEAEIRRLVDELPGVRALAAVGPRVDANDLHSPTAYVEGHRLVDEKARRVEVTQPCRP
jgi:hypothetical protein